MVQQIYITNPNQGNINPGTTEDQKLFLKTVDERATRLTIKQENVKDILVTFEADLVPLDGDHWLMSLRQVIPIPWVNHHQPYNILYPQNGKKMPIELGVMESQPLLQLFLHFFRFTISLPLLDTRTESSFSLDVSDLKWLQRGLKRGLTSTSWKTLLLKKKEFSWKDTTLG